MVVYPCLRALSPQCAELPEEPDIGVEFARGPEPTHDIVGANGMNEHALCVALAQFPIVNQFCHESQATARISRISEELKLISLTRFMISRALVGLSGRSIGLTCTMRMSRDWHE